MDLNATWDNTIVVLSLGVYCVQSWYIPSDSFINKTIKIPLRTSNSFNYMCVTDFLTRQDN